MSALLRMNMGVFGAGLACLWLSSAQAQQTIESGVERAQERGSAAARADIEGTTESSQTDRARPGQADSNRAEQNRLQSDQQHQRGQRHTARSRGVDGAGRGNDQQVQQFIVACLLEKNQNEIEAAQNAEQQAQNPEVKKFAQMLVQDHQQMVQKLQQLQQGQGGTTQQPGAATQDQSATTTTRIDAQRQANDGTRLPGSSGAGQPSGTDAQSTDVTIGTTDENRSLTINTQDGQARQAGRHGGAIQQLMAIDRAINERCAAAMKEELQQKQGAEYDMAFVGSQIGGHMQMVATLEVLGQQGPEQVQQLAQQALPKIQAHLDQAKQLKDQLKSGSAGDASQAERPQPGATRTPR